MCIFGKEELKTARTLLKYSAADMARALNTPLRTYQEWEAGTNRIPGIAEVAVRLLIERDKWVMGNVLANIDRRIKADFPEGIICGGYQEHGKSIDQGSEVLCVAAGR